MEKAKAAIADFVGRSGKHDTTVHEAVAPAVQHETVKPHEHEEINTAVDKEVHQDHYHRSVQPVQDREVLPETHTAKLGAVQNREFDNRDHEATKRNLVEDQARFQNKTRTEATTSSRSAAPAVGGEHVHHHIHETIQPVVHKETVQPNVVHTTVPIHEVHHNKATHHDTSALPAMSMDQFKSQGGSLTGREERFDEFQGVPKNIGAGSAGGFGTTRTGEHKSINPTEHSRHGDYESVPNHHGTSGGVAGATGAAVAGGVVGHKEHHHDRNAPGQGTLPGFSTGTGGLTGATQHDTDRNLTGQGLTGSSTSAGVTDATQHHHADRGVGGQGNLTGSSTLGGVAPSSSREHDLSSSDSNTNQRSNDDRYGAGVVPGVHSSDHDLAHRQNEDGELPKALVEDKSRAVPHSSLHDDKHTQGTTHDNTTGSTTHKPSLMDKLNPKVDSNGDGQAGFLK